MIQKSPRYPIKIPVAINHPAYLGRFSREVSRSIRALIERIWDVNIYEDVKFVQEYPWRPRFNQNENTIQLTFSPGTLNNIIASNWQEVFEYAAGNQAKYVVLNFTASSGKIASYTISVDNSPPQANSVDVNSLSGSGKFLIGLLSNARAAMLYKRNLVAYGQRIMTIGKSVPSAGGEPFDRHFQWQAVEAIADV